MHEKRKKNDYTTRAHVNKLVDDQLTEKRKEKSFFFLFYFLRLTNENVDLISRSYIYIHHFHSDGKSVRLFTSC